MTESPDKEECIICLDTSKNLSRVSNCSHSFCFSCILNWSKVTNTCPVCKKEFNSITACNTPTTDGYSRKVIRVKRKIQRVAHDDDRNFLPNEVLTAQANQGQQQRRRVHGYDFDADELFHDADASEAAYRRQSLHDRLLASVYGAMNASASHSPSGARGRNPRARRDRNNFISTNEDHPHWLAHDREYRPPPFFNFQEPFLHDDHARASASGRLRMPSSRGSNRSVASTASSVRLPTPRTYICKSSHSSHLITDT
jgi:hypothetical protein